VRSASIFQQPYRQYTGTQIQIALRERDFQLAHPQFVLDCPQVLGHNPLRSVDGTRADPYDQFEIQRIVAEPHQPHIQRMLCVLNRELETARGGQRGLTQLRLVAAVSDTEQQCNLRIESL